ncbi:hypothetical protein NDU88_001743 [Pleurodeles waltl]|uniref:Uncharacterized protein n=1 Tax=Pleurodeles waltl TaxID=8319 RepID=A0AAV7LAF3_PLEWA|nr:hypothetical protein NDU88_001743 [Pleurodeles waltl]
MGESVAHASFSKRARVHRDLVHQAPLALESGGEPGNAPFDERQLGGAANMAASSELRAYLPGCVAPHVLSGHGVSVEHQRSGRPAGGPLSVGVRAPLGRRLEERAQSGAVRLTAREVAPLEARSLESNARVWEPRSDSRSAILGGDEEEELDYGDDGDQVVAVPQASTSGQEFQGEWLSWREVAANLSRVEGELCRRLLAGWAREGEARRDSRRPITSGLLQELLGVLGEEDYRTHRGLYSCMRMGSLLTAYQLLVVLRRALGWLGMDNHYYGTHSFRIGAATEARALKVNRGRGKCRELRKDISQENRK